MSNTTLTDNLVLMYDIQSLPFSLDEEQVVTIFKNERVVFYDSIRSRGKGIDPTPKIFMIGQGEMPDINVIDTKDLSPKEVRDLVSFFEENMINKKDKLDKLINGYCCGPDGSTLMTKYTYFLRVIKELPTGWLIPEDYTKEFDDTRYTIQFPPLTEEY